MVATYSIEYPGLLIEKDRRQYALLTADEMQTCGNTAIKYCSPKNAVLPVNMHNLCILALFDIEWFQRCNPTGSILSRKLTLGSQYVVFGSFKSEYNYSSSFEIVIDSNQNKIAFFFETSRGPRNKYLVFLPNINLYDNLRW